MNLGEKYIDRLGDLFGTIPSIQYLHAEAQPYVLARDEKNIKKYQNLIYYLHNSFVSPETRMGSNVKFGYGGIGVVIHKNAIIGNGVSVSQNVTIGGTPGSYNFDESGDKFFVPIVRDNVYIACGSKILGAIIVNKFTIVGANSVLLENTENFSVYAGNPAKKIKDINKENCLKYRSFFFALSLLSKDEYIDIFP